MIDFTNFEECQITAMTDPYDAGKIIIRLKITEGKFSRVANFRLTDEERVWFAKELLEM